MLSSLKGKPIARIIGGEYDGELVHLYEDEEPKPCCNKCSKKCERRPCCRGCGMCYKDDSHIIGKEIILKNSSLEPLLNIYERNVDYNAGPSGSGKTTMAAKKALNYQKIFPEKELFIFSRTDIKADKALSKLKGSQILIDESLIDNPIDIEKELTGGCIIIFDDCNTIQNEKHKKAVEKLMADIMEVGRKLDINIIMTNHLVIPNEKKIARTILNEMQSLTVFPKSGASQQIRYTLKQYFGMNNKQIEKILQLPSRWVQINKTYPMTVLHEKGCYLL